MTDGPLWEVFVRPRRGVSHGHVGSVHAHDGEQALQAARDLFTRRSEGVSLWVVPAADIVASNPADAGQLFDPAADKDYRFPPAHVLPDEVDYM